MKKQVGYVHMTSQHFYRTFFWWGAENSIVAALESVKTQLFLSSFMAVYLCNHLAYLQERKTDTKFTVHSVNTHNKDQIIFFTKLSKSGDGIDKRVQCWSVNMTFSLKINMAAPITTKNVSYRFIISKIDQKLSRKTLLANVHYLCTLVFKEWRCAYRASLTVTLWLYSSCSLSLCAVIFDTVGAAALNRMRCGCRRGRDCGRCVSSEAYKTCPVRKNNPNKACLLPPFQRGHRGREKKKKRRYCNLCCQRTSSAPFKQAATEGCLVMWRCVCVSFQSSTGFRL